jgi:hypothetical protein
MKVSKQLTFFVLILSLISILSKHLRTHRDELKPMEFQSMLEKTVEKIKERDQEREEEEEEEDVAGKVDDGEDDDSENGGADDPATTDDDESDDFKELDKGKSQDDYYQDTDEKGGDDEGAVNEVDDDSSKRRLQEKFNVFKSYADSPRKPPQYAKRNVKHGIREYLTPNQQYMMSVRNGPESGPDMFSGDWSGFSKSN